MDARRIAPRVRTAAPHPALAAHVRSYVSTEAPIKGVSLAALPAPVLFMTWGGAVQILTAGGQTLPAVVLFGPSTRVHHAAVGEGACGFHIRFTPTGARALLGERALPNSWDDGLPTAVQRWAETVAEATDFEARVALADAFLRARLPGYDVRSSRAVGLVAGQPGAASVAAVAETLGVSERTLRRHFADDVGVGLKTFAQIERYRQAHGLLLRTPEASWRDVCDRFGYADQAHFVRSFHRFAGAPPSRWHPDEHRFDLGFGLREEGA